MTKKRYLVAVDGSEWSDRAADWAVKLAQETGAEVCFVSAIDEAKHQPLYVKMLSAPPKDLSDVEAQVRLEILTPLEAKYADSGVKVTSEVLSGHPTKVIKDWAKKRRPKMIVAGRRGRSKVADLVLGSVANSLAHMASVPVVLVP